MVEIDRPKKNHCSRMQDIENLDVLEELAPDDDDYNDFELIIDEEATGPTNAEDNEADDEDKFRGIQDVLDQITNTLRDFVRSTRERPQIRYFNSPLGMRTMDLRESSDARIFSYLLSEGEGQTEEVLRSVRHRNISVGVSLASCSQLMWLMFGIHTLLVLDSLFSSNSDAMFQSGLRYLFSLVTMVSFYRISRFINC
ncbi:uncharacterized protein LOC132699917 isoform X1 [Cylas formicarius]|uniref:uncharacterized protein LOC132699917 isoform X1 n=1 Tax=Cylas formicarius TaxID=197179 RepID=UPI0029583768|nr:uncharacterized protein LOC132699917 isoform X1 [Cylas formicarius]